MRTFAQKQNSTKQAESIGGTREHPGKIHGMRSMPLARNMVGNHAPQGVSEEHQATIPGHDFSRIPVHARAPVTVQPKLTIGSPGDRYEREADHVADWVMSAADSGRGEISTGSTSNVHRNCSSCEGDMGGQEVEQEEEERLQLKAAGTSGNMSSSAESMVSGIRSGGTPLPAGERTFFEGRFRRSFSDVRIHTDARADAASQAIGARAFTLGRHVAFADGEYRPKTEAGRWLMAHELTHTIQQAQDTVQRLPCRYGSGEATHTVNVQPVVIAEDDGSAPTSTCNFGTVSNIWSRCCINLNVQSTQTENESDYKILDFTPNVATAEPSALIASYASATTIPVIFHDLLRPSGGGGSKNGGTGGAFTRGGRIIFTVDGVAPEVVAHEIGHALGSGHSQGTRADGVDTVMKPSGGYNSSNAQNVSQTICDNARASGFSTGGADPDCCQDLS